MRPTNRGLERAFVVAVKHTGARWVADVTEMATDELPEDRTAIWTNGAGETPGIAVQDALVKMWAA